MSEATSKTAATQLGSLLKSQVASCCRAAVYDEQVKPQLLPDPCTPGPVREALHRVVDAAWANSTREILHPGAAPPAPSNRSPVLSEAAAVREDATGFEVCHGDCLGASCGAPKLPRSAGACAAAVGDGLRAARAALLYHYAPYDKSAWACLTSPSWLLLAVALAWPCTPLLRAALLASLLASLAADAHTPSQLVMLRWSTAADQS